MISIGNPLSQSDVRPHKMIYIGLIESAEGEVTALSKTLPRNVGKTAGSGRFKGAESSAVHMAAY